VETNLSPLPDSEHASLSAHRTDVSASRIRTEASQQFESDVPLHRHGTGVDFENLGASLQMIKMNNRFL